MKTNNKLLVPLLGLMLICYILAFALCLFFSILFLGYLEPIFIAISGIINSIFVRKILNTNILKSILLGFTISAFGLLLVFCFWHLKIVNSAIGIIILICFSVLTLAFLKKYENKICSFKNVFLLIFLCIYLIGVYILKDFHPNENRHIEKFTFKVVDIHEKPIVGDSIDVSILRQPMFNLQGLYKKENLITNQKGEFTVFLSRKTKYRIRIYDNDDWMKGIFEIGPDTEETNLTLKLNK